VYDFKQPLEQSSSDALLSRILRDDYADFRGVAIDVKRVRDADRATSALCDEPGHIRSHRYLAFDELGIEMIDDMEEAAVAVVGRGVCENVAIAIRIARSEAPNVHGRHDPLIIRVMPLTACYKKSPLS